MKCRTCGIESRTVIQENERLFDRGIYLKDRLAPTYVLIFSFIFDSHTQISYKLVFVFIISMLFYWMLLSKVSYYSAFTVMGKRGLAALNVCGVIASLIFSYAAILYVIGLLGQGYSVGFLYFWFGVFVLGSIIGKSLVFSERKLKDFGKLYRFYLGKSLIL
jgi:hypothetical protein